MKTLYQKARINIDHDSIDKENSSLRGIFSTEDEDRQGDIIRQDWDLKSFKKNPVVINSHQYYDATEVIGKVEDIKVNQDKQLEGKIKFAAEENPKAKVIFDLYSGGFLNAFSVGFIPKQFDDKGTILKSELLELSTVSVPANAFALAKSKGIDVDFLYKDGKLEEKKTEEEDEEEIEDITKENLPDEDVKEEEPEVEEEKPEEEEKEEKKEPDGWYTDKDGKRVEKNIIKSDKGKNLKVAKVINKLCEKIEVETRSENDRVENNRLLNKAIRSLIKMKGRLKKIIEKK